MIQTIQEQALLCADVLEKTVRGIRPRVGALANPREGEPMEYVLVLADIIQANDRDKVRNYSYQKARNKYEKGQLDKYKSACVCTIQNINEQVRVLELCAMVGDTTLD